MKKIMVITVSLMLLLCCIGCSSEDVSENLETTIEELRQGDAVSIVGQVASSGLVNGNTLWVQVKSDDGTFVVYHCQLKDEYIESAEQFKILDVVKVSGTFLGLTEFEQENTSTLVTLYDCELITK